jgi:hypothetical protein
MLISNKHKFIFVKNRKVAGSTFEKLIFPHLGPDDVCTGSPTDNTPRLNEVTGAGHMSSEEIRTIYPKQWNDYYKFAIERNPWDKCVSAFKWHAIIKPHITGVRENDFKLYLKHQQPLLPTDWSSYTKDNVIATDTVFTVENISKLYDVMRERFKIDIPEEIYYNTKLKQTKREHYSHYYDDESREIVERLFQNEIKTFGYEYEQG